MTVYVFDTDTCIYWLNGNPGVSKKVEKHGTDGLNITMITYAELRFGAYNSQRVRENLDNIDFFLKGVSVLPLTRQAADSFGRIKANLRQKGDIIGDFDILIAAVTMELNATLITNNLSHFRRIEKLSCENWLD